MQSNVELLLIVTSSFPFFLKELARHIYLMLALCFLNSTKSWHNISSFENLKNISITHIDKPFPYRWKCNKLLIQFLTTEVGDLNKHRWLSGLERSPRKRKVLCSNPTASDPSRINSYTLGNRSYCHGSSEITKYKRNLRVTIVGAR